MSVRVQVILGEKEAAKFKSHAHQESKSLSAWLRDAGKSYLESQQSKRALTDLKNLKEFFQECNERERGVEPDWEEQKMMILSHYQMGQKL